MTAQGLPTASIVEGAYTPDPGGSVVARKSLGRRVAVGGIVAAVGLAVLSGLVASREPAGREAAEAMQATPSSSAAGGPYRPPSLVEVELANIAARQELQTGGAPGVARYGLDCFRRLEQQPSYRMLDFCVAFDLFAARHNAALSGSDRVVGDSWFQAMEAHHLNVARAILGGEGDPGARLVDLRRMVGASVEADGPDPTVRRRARPLRTQVRAAAQRPAVRRAAVAPAGPSFNCRYARGRPEEMICRDAELAAADRRLDRAYRAAVDAGIPEWELRAAQDRWLGERESASSDTASLAAAYEQRIGELEAVADRPSP